MDLVQVIYCSRPFGFDNAVLNGILSDARRCNERDAVTGASSVAPMFISSCLKVLRQRWTQRLHALRRTIDTSK